MVSLLLKQDQLKFTELAKRVLPRKGQGCLVFLTCDRSELVDEVQQGLQEKLRGGFSFQTHSCASGEALLGPLPSYDANKPVFHILTGYPYALLEQQDPSLTSINRKLAASLNVERDLIPNRNLHLAFIIPQLVENTIALVAPDFYHFRSYSAHFHDDKVPHRQPAQSLDLKTLERTLFLENRLKQSGDIIHKANTHLELAKLNMTTHDRELAQKHLDSAIKLFKRQKADEGLAHAYMALAKFLADRNMIKQAFSAYLSALKYVDHHSPEKRIIHLNLAEFSNINCAHIESENWLNKINENLLDDEQNHMVKYIRSRTFSTLGKTHLAENTLLDTLKHLSKRGNKVLFIYHSGLLFLQLGKLDQLNNLIKEDPTKAKQNETQSHTRFILLGEWELVETQILDAIAESKDYFLSALHKLNLALLFSKRFRHQLAEQTAEQALEFWGKVELEYETRKAKAFLTKIQRRTKPLPEVEASCLKYLDEWKEGPAYERAELLCTLGFIYADTDRLELAQEKVKETLSIAEPASYRYIEGEAAMLLARIQGKQGNWDGAYVTLKAGYERIRERDMAMEAEILELMGQAAEHSGNPRAKGWYQKALSLYNMLHLPQAEPLAQQLKTLGIEAAAPSAD